MGLIKGFQWYHLLWVLGLMWSVQAVSLDGYRDRDEMIPRTPQIIIAVVLIVVGVLKVLVGHKVLRIVVFLGGFMLLGVGVFYLAKLFVDIETCSQGQRIGVYAGSAFAGLIGGGLAACCIELGMIILGGCLGYVMAAAVINVLPSQTGQIILIVCMILGFAVLAFIFKKIILILSTSAIGAAMYVGGIDIITRTGILKYIFFNDETDYDHTTKVQLWCILASGILLCFIGLVLQFIILSKSRESLFKRNDRPSTKHYIPTPYHHEKHNLMSDP